MFGNILLLALGAWGLYYTWTRRSKAGSSLFFDLASPVRYPKTFIFVIALRLFVFGLCFSVAAYRIIFGLTE